MQLQEHRFLVKGTWILHYFCPCPMLDYYFLYSSSMFSHESRVSPFAKAPVANL
jgi:hypothetical protein